MSLTALQHRVRSRNRRVALLVKLEIPDYGDIYLTDNAEPFEIPGVTVNPVIISMDGLDMNDQTRVSDIRLTVKNGKSIEQAGNPLAEAIRMSDLIKEGLAQATLTAKELLAAVKPISITSWSSADLGELFSGPVQEPFDFDNKTLTISSTGLERKAYEDIPGNSIGEVSDTDPTGDLTLIPAHFGHNIAFTNHSKGYLLGLEWPTKVGRNLNGTHAPLWRYPQESDVNPGLVGTEITLVADSILISVLDVMLEIGGFPGPCMACSNRYRTGIGWELQWKQRTHDTLGYTLVDLVHANGIYTYYQQRMKNDPEQTYTEDWRELAKPYGYVVLDAQNTTVGLATPVLPGTVSDTTQIFEAFIFRIEVGAEPDDADLEVRFDWFKRDGSFQETMYTRNLTSADKGEGGYWTGMADFLNCKNYMASQHGWTQASWWKFANSEGGVRCIVKRTDGNGGVLQIRGIYCALFFRYFGGPLTDNKNSSLRYLVAAHGRGAVDVGEDAHPVDIFRRILSDELGLSAPEIDIRDVGDFWDTVGWEFGWAEVAARRKSDLPGALAEQTTMMLVRDSDGVHRLRLAARFDAKPDWQRFTEPLVNGRDIFNMRVRQPGPDWIKNSVRVNYASGALAAWGNKYSSGDGYGNTLPLIQTYAQTSFNDHGFEGRLTIDGWAVRDHDTAAGIRNHHFATRAEYCAEIEFNAGGLGEFLNVGEYVTFQAASMDAELLFAGQTWGGLWFQIIRKAKWGRYWTFTAIEPPKIDLIGMTPAVVLFPTPISG